MPYTRQIGRDFWYDFDNQTLWQRTSEVSDALRQAYFSHDLTLDSPAEVLRTSFTDPTHPAPFLAVVAPGREGFLQLAAIELSIIDRHLSDNSAIQSAFEDFGQGVLYDDRPPRGPGRLVHMMDGTPEDWVGYQRWHAFIRAVQLLNPADTRWLHIDRCLSLAWAIQTETNPPVDNPANPGVSAARLDLLRSAWLPLTTSQLDWAFATHQFRAPAPNEIRIVGEGRWSRVQRIFEEATVGLHPVHGGKQRFWLLPLDRFVAAEIYGHKLIAPPGENRGERSDLIQALRGTLPGVPRMPLNAPSYLSDQQIDFVSKWIDADCPME